MEKADILLCSNLIFDSISDSPFSGAVAVKDNKIIAVCKGNKTDDFIDGNTKILNYENKLIMPSFIDAHDHMYSGIVNLSDHVCTTLIDSKSETDCVRMIKEYADSHMDEKRIRGCGWFPINWGGASLPTKHSLDQAIPDRPVYLMSADSHTCWLNSKAIEEVGVRPDWKLSSGSVGIGVDGEPNGLLFEPEAFTPAVNYMMDFSDEEFSEIMQEQLNNVVALGITGMSDMGGYAPGYETEAIFKRFKKVEEAGELPLRLYFYMSLANGGDYSEVLKCQEKYNSDMFKINGVKGFVDGVTSTFTGYLLEPYEDKPDTCGEGCPMFSVAEGNDWIARANSLGLSVRLHCIGDAAVRQALDMYENSIRINGPLSIHNTVEHIEVIHPSDIKRFKELNTVASMQPAHLPLDLNEKVTRCGMRRSTYAWNHRSLLEKGAILAFGTDFPIVGLNPFTNIYAAVARCYDNGMPTGTNPWECISVADAIKAYTIGSAHAYNQQNILGTLETGKLADIVVVDRNIFDIEYVDIRDALPVMTMLDGKIVFERDL